MHIVGVIIYALASKVAILHPGCHLLRILSFLFVYRLKIYRWEHMLVVAIHGL